MKQLYFIRHGLSEMNQQNLWSGQTDTPLAPKGHEQARLAGKTIKKQGMQFDVIVSSPLQRAHDTAKHIAEHIDYAPDHILVHDLFKERNFGKLEGTSKFSIHTAEYLLSEASIDKYDDVETYVDLQRRADAAHEYLMSLGKDSVLVVAHGAFGRALHRSITNGSTSIQNIRYKNAQIVRFV